MPKEIRTDRRKRSAKRKFYVTVEFGKGQVRTLRFFVVWAYMFHDAFSEVELFDDDVKELERTGWHIQSINVQRGTVQNPKGPGV